MTRPFDWPAFAALGGFIVLWVGVEFGSRKAARWWSERSGKRRTVRR